MRRHLKIPAQGRDDNNRNGTSLLDETKRLCNTFLIRPSRSKGQNFLIDPAAYDAMIAASGVSKDDVVLEVGPGLGFLTERLAGCAKKVITVELDDQLANVLVSRLNENKIENVSVHNEDVMNFTGEWAKEIKREKKFSVVANLPYNISSIFLRKFLSGNEGNIFPERLTLMLQKEVAERLVAPPGRLSVLGVSAQTYMEGEITDVIPSKSFWPEPKVDSAVIVLRRHKKIQTRLQSLGISESIFFRVVKIGFSARRKMVKANLAAGLHLPVAEAVKRLETAGIPLSARAQELSIEEWVKTVVAFRDIMV